MSKHQHIAVTGATGFLGQHLCERLLGEGRRLSILARDRAKADAYEGRADRIVIGDIADPSAVAELVEGMDAVIHLVSNFRTASGPPESYRRINVLGTQTVLEACRTAGVKRLIHCSTIGVHGDVRSTPADESSPFNPGDLYQETKLEAEELVRAAASQDAPEIVIVRPCSMYGPGDMRMLKMFKLLSKRIFFLVGPCAENFHAVYIDDVVAGFVRILDAEGLAGETFILGGERYLSLKDYIGVVARAVGAPPPFLKFPYGLFYGAAVACETLCVPFGIEPPLHRRRVRFYRNNRAFDISKARKVLGHAPQVSLEEGMRRTVSWYRENGYL
jgi:nucleoside-diphosphate-sugar epimerase